VHGPPSTLINVASRNHFTRPHGPLRAFISPPPPRYLKTSPKLGVNSNFCQSTRYWSLSAHHTTQHKMSSPSQRRQRGSQAGTPRRSARQSESGTPNDRASQLASSPLFFQSSPDANGNAGEVSSPLRQMSHSQSTQEQVTALPSSPLRQGTESQETGDGERTPRASGMIGGKILLQI
jgi:hypothetical protein